MKNSLSDVSWRRQERETGGEIQTTIDTSLETLGIPAPHQVEENMSENHFRQRLMILCMLEYAACAVQNPRERGNGRCVRRRANSNLAVNIIKKIVNYRHTPTTNSWIFFLI